MKHPRLTPEAARAKLEEQLDQLDQFRNASTRDAQFKQWRQSTLTVIHRIWPGGTQRSSRFRRIPFSPPSTRADARQARDAYERGCSEATQLMRGWITEIETHGIQLEAAADRVSPTGESTGSAVPTREASTESQGRHPDDGAPPAPPAKAARRAGRLKDMLGLAHLAAATGGPDESTRLEGERPALRPFQGSPLEIPGFTDHPEPAAGFAPSMPGLRPPLPPLDLGMPDDASTTHMPSPEPPDIADLELTVVDDAAPAQNPQTRPADPAGAAEVIALAGEVARHDVPAAECERVRNTLLDLARAIESGQPSWDALRSATVVVMHYPRLGRRAMPVLLPFLDHTA